MSIELFSLDYVRTYKKYAAIAQKEKLPLTYIKNLTHLKPEQIKKIETEQYPGIERYWAYLGYGKFSGYVYVQRLSESGKIYCSRTHWLSDSRRLHIDLDDSYFFMIKKMFIENQNEINK
jgi:hypothetical protein